MIRDFSLWVRPFCRYVDTMLNHEKFDRMALPTVKKMKFQQILFKLILWQNKYFGGKIMDCNFLQHDLRGDFYFILK